jgi:hypothetical protein
MRDDSGLPTQLITLGVALVAFGLGCHFWSDRVYRTAGLAIGAIQLCRHFLHGRIGGHQPRTTSENRIGWMKVCDHLTAVLLVMAVIHTIATASG